jgi:hypothetical protein
MAELYEPPATALLPAASEALAPADATAVDPAVTARQPVLPEVLAASGAIPPHALAIASAPTAPKQALARGSTRRLGCGTVVEGYEKHTRELWLDEDDARTRGRCALKRRPTAPKLAA